RDFHVTGVQTCALPIWTLTRRNDRPFRVQVDVAQAEHLRDVGIPADFLEIDILSGPGGERRSGFKRQGERALRRADSAVAALERSEERRVGKECRYRCW